MARTRSAHCRDCIAYVRLYAVTKYTLLRSAKKTQMMVTFWKFFIQIKEKTPLFVQREKFVISRRHRTALEMNVCVCDVDVDGGGGLGLGDGDGSGVHRM